MNKFEIFVNVSDKEMCEIYKDIVESKEAGLRPRNLDSYAKQIKEICRFEMFSEATDFVIELFYEEIAIRYFKAYSRRVIEAEELRKIMEQDDMLETVSKNDLKIIGYCPEKGYTSWVFKYKDAYVLLHDAGNGHYEFMEELGDISKLHIDTDYRSYGKYNYLEELSED